MITVPQIKAARALLGWTQRDLAKISGLSLAAIAQIESGAGNPRLATMTLLQQSFEKYDVMFSDDPGVSIKREPFSVSVWQGREAILRVWEDIEATFGDGHGGEVLLSAVADDLWEDLHPGQLPLMIARRKALNIFTRGLIARAEDIYGGINENYRLVAPQALSAHTPYYVYAGKVALIKMIEPIRVVVIQNATLAESFRKQFEYLWSTGNKRSA